MLNRERLAQSDIPEGFDAFWRDALSEALAAPLDYTRTFSRDQATHVIEELEFRGITGAPLRGWIALPPVRSAPGFLWIAPYGRWSMLPNQYGTRQGFASLSFNFFGEPAFHQEDYTPERGYFAEGVESKEAWVYRRMFQDAAIAARILADLPEVDGTRLASCGMSQGGGMSIWLGAFHPLIRAVCADMPFLAGLAPYFEQSRVYRYPLKELADWIAGDEVRKSRLLETLRWYDTAHMASRCRVPTQLTLGRKDPTVKPAQVHLLLEELPGIRTLDEIDWGHDWHPSMVQRNLDWMKLHLG